MRVIFENNHVPAIGRFKDAVVEDPTNGKFWMYDCCGTYVALAVVAGIPTGGTTGQVLAKASSTNLDTEWVDQTGGGAVDSVAGKTGVVTLVKGDVGLGSVDNTSDANKPVSTATQTALNLKADDADLTSHTGNTSNPHSVTKTQVGLSNVDNTSDDTKNSATVTITNHRVTPRIGTTASSGTPAPNADSHDQYNVTALGEAATFGAPTGTPTDGQKLTVRIKDDGTGRSLSWNAIYRAIGVTLPTVTVANKTHYLGMIYNLADTKWDVVAVGQEA